MYKQLEKLKSLLRELFQLDQSDLDFGIYRIMNQKREEIEQFLDRDLLPQVQIVLKEYQGQDVSQIQQELSKAIQQAKEMGVDPLQVPKAQKLQETLNQAQNTESLELQVYSDLYNFFRRYYSNGDFLSLRRYKEGVYAIPYEGEEVKLHWANADQYYIKSSEYLRNYTFKITNGKRVHFKVVDASGELNNNKASNGNERRFVLCDDTPLLEQEDELYLRFTYLPDEEKRKQDALNKEAVGIILSHPGFEEWRMGLEEKRPTEKNPNRTLLEKHLSDFTARNTFDYFIHKDLGGFLQRELDFFIKNEIMHLDDIENEDAPKVEQYLAKIKALRKIGGKIICFLAQIENFQKLLWLKKKFVVETQYCITLDRVPKELYPEILQNKMQLEEWKHLFDWPSPNTSNNGDSLFSSVPNQLLTVNDLEANPFLVLDTKFFDERFKQNLLSSIEDLDEKTDGLLIHSENFQALNLLKSKYDNNVQCIYIDPPYNTQKDIFLYKDGYKESSWISLIKDRCVLAKSLLSNGGVIFCSIDRNEVATLKNLFNEIFSAENSIGELVWRNVRDNNPTQIAIEHEYIICFSKNRINAQPIWKNRYSDAKEMLINEYTRLKSIGLAINEIQNQLRDFIRDNQASLVEVDRYKFVDEHGVFTGSQSVHNPHPGGYMYEILHPITARPMRMPANGYRFPFDTLKNNYLDTGRILYGPDENRIIQIKIYLEDYQDSLRSVIDLDGRLGSYALNEGFGRNTNVFDNPKPPQLLKRLISFGSNNNSILMDFFAGSGSFALSAIDISKQTKSSIKYILIEMADYFNTVLKPRIQKVIYSKDWKDGKPLSREGSSHLFKYIRLESYEDTLNNLELCRTKEQDNLLSSAEIDTQFKEDYMLSYILDVESEGSASLLNIDRFEDPFNYQMKIATGDVGETKLLKVDLMETFNYLIGLKVRHIDFINGYQIAEGENRQRERILVIWRNLKEKDNDDLDQFFQRQRISTQDREYDIIYVNGDNNLENLRREDETWKVRLIEEEFKRRMFDVQDI